VTLKYTTGVALNSLLVDVIVISTSLLFIVVLALDRNLILLFITVEFTLFLRWIGFVLSVVSCSIMTAWNEMITSLIHHIAENGIPTMIILMMSFSPLSKVAACVNCCAKACPSGKKNLMLVERLVPNNHILFILTNS
jgi:hypothetical protein